MSMSGKGMHEFLWEEDSEGRLVFLGSRGDCSEMNWVLGSRRWGTVHSPGALEVQVNRELLDNGRLREVYRFTNVTEFPVSPLTIIMKRRRSAWREDVTRMFSAGRRLCMCRPSAWEGARRTWGCS